MRDLAVTGEVPGVAPAGAGRGWGVVVLTHTVIALLGAGILVGDAVPFVGPAIGSMPNADYWGLLIGNAVVLGGVGGLLEGLAFRHGRRGLAVAVLMAAAVPGIWLPLLTLGRWFPDQSGDVIQAGHLAAGLVGWLLLMLIAALTATAVGRRRRVG